GIAEENQLRMAIAAAQDLGPRRLDIVQHERYELNLALLLRRLFNRTTDGRTVGGRRAVVEESKEILPEEQAQNQKDQRAANAERRSSKTEAAAARSAAILDVGAFSTGRPAHDRHRSTKSARWR